MAVVTPAIWLARHAPVTVSGICYGHADVPTAGDGGTSADRIVLSAGGADETWEEVWASPSARTLSIAKALAQRLGRPLRVDERLRELHFGSWEGRSYRDIELETPEVFRRWLDRYETEGPPGGESAASLRRRVESWMLERSRGGRTAIAVTHAGVIRSARAIVAGHAYGHEALREVEPLAVERFSIR